MNSAESVYRDFKCSFQMRRFEMFVKHLIGLSVNMRSHFNSFWMYWNLETTSNVLIGYGFMLFCWFNRLLLRLNPSIQRLNVWMFCVSHTYQIRFPLNNRLSWSRFECIRFHIVFLTHFRRLVVRLTENVAVKSPFSS